MDNWKRISKELRNSIRIGKPSQEELAAANELLDHLAAEHKEIYGSARYTFNFSNTEAAKLAQKAPEQAQRILLFAALERLRPYSISQDSGMSADEIEVPMMLARGLIKKKLAITEEDALQLLSFAASVQNKYINIPANSLVKLLERFAENAPVSKQLTEACRNYRDSVDKTSDSDAKKAALRLEDLDGRVAARAIEPGEAWSDALIEFLETLGTNQSDWIELIAYSQTASAGKPSAEWLAAGRPLLDKVGLVTFEEQLIQWFPLVDKPRTQVIESWSEWAPNPNLLIVGLNADALKGLLWLASGIDSPALARATATLALSAYRKVPGIGPRAVKIGNACVWSLGNMHGDSALAALASLKVKVRFKTAQKGIEKALQTLAERAGVTTEELEEIGVPAFGLDEVGVHRASWEEYAVELRVTERFKAELRWSNKGKVQASIPKYVKDNHGDDLKELKQAVKDINSMIPAQRERLDGLFLAEKSWEFEHWRTHYLNHPLVGCLARKLIWTFTTSRTSKAAIWYNDQLVDENNHAFNPMPDKSTVSLWHPLGQPTDQVIAWREWFESQEIRQPFKQAHREVYVLTDAERATDTYSNRFAGHVLKQHQFNALCSERHWNNSLRLMVDDEYLAPERKLGHWKLRAEYWVEGAGDEYGVDTNEAGTYLYLATDQVRFYQHTAAASAQHAAGGGYHSLGTDREENRPISLTDVPPLVLSEVLRDIDLFVGVASVGNDPNWQDGGPEGRYAEYWQRTSFGELSETALGRKRILERLIPKLKIADRCTFEGKFLIVRGDVRTYKIHLGSSNILMEPNDKYLCIVASQAKSKYTEKLYIPFEGDGRLALVISKALLLADDKKIKDKTILSQIHAI